MVRLKNCCFVVLSKNVKKHVGGDERCDDAGCPATSTGMTRVVNQI